MKELRKRVKAGEDKAEVAKAFNISRASTYNYVREHLSDDIDNF